MWFSLYHNGPLIKECTNVKEFLLKCYIKNKHKYKKTDIFHQNFKSSYLLVNPQLKIPKDAYVFKCVIDDTLTHVPTCYLEGPCVFVGNHPLRGTCKIGVLKQNVMVNISPKYCEELKRRGFLNFTYKRDVNWFASWLDEITKERKYLYIPYNHTLAKFERARSLKAKINMIRKTSLELTFSDKPKEVQLGLACYLLDVLCIRIGHEREYDTVGICTLSTDHVMFLLPHQKVRFIFCGKDNIPFDKTITIPEQYYNGLYKCFTSSKEQKESTLFYLLTPTIFNNYLSKFSSDITAKVFRTCKACILFQKEYRKNKSKNEALLKVAKLLNHKKIDKKTKKYVYNLTTSWNNYIDHRIFDNKDFMF